MKKQIADFFIQCNGENAGTLALPTWQLTVIDIAESIKEAQELGALQRARVLNMAQAEAEGYTLPSIFSEATKAAVARAEAALEAHAALAESVNDFVAEKLDAAVTARLAQMGEAVEEVEEKKSLLNKFTFGLLK